MKLLLDTHVWIWAMVEPERLRQSVRKALEDSTTDLYLSPISVWEFLLLVEKGRLQLAEAPNRWLRTTLRELNLKEARLDFESALLSRELQLHNDPADRFIAATAITRKLTLVTADRRLLDCPQLEDVLEA